MQLVQIPVASYGSVYANNISVR